MRDERFGLHICPHCGQRNKVEGRAVCQAGEEQYEKILDDAATALLDGAEMPQVWDNIFVWAFHIGKTEIFPKLEKELEALKAEAAKRKEEIRRQVIADIANRMRGKEGSIPAAVREKAVEKAVADAEYNDEAIKRAHGRGLGLEDLRKHLLWLQTQIGSSQKRQTA